MKLSDISASRCANEHAWYEPIWRLIVSENTQECDVDDVMETEMVMVVIEIIHIVMWSGIVGSDTPSWVVSGFQNNLFYSTKDGLREKITSFSFSYFRNHQIS